MSIVPVLVASSLAVLFVVLEQWKGEKPWRSWRLWLALICLVATIAAVVVESLTAKALDKERHADLLLIQKQNVALNTLCFELNLQPFDDKYNEGCYFQVQTYSRVAAQIANTGLIAEYIQFKFHPDKGWYRSGSWIQSWPGVELEYDSANQTVRFEMTPFGIRSQERGVLYWKTERLADLAQVRFQAQMMYRVEPGEPPALGSAYIEPTDLRWSPVNNIRLYANSYRSENLITTLVPRVRSYGDRHNTIYFHPDRQPVNDTDWFAFYVDLLEMRPNILKNLDQAD